MQNKERSKRNMAVLLALCGLLEGVLAQPTPELKAPSALVEPSVLQKDVREYDRLLVAIRQAGLKKQRDQIPTVLSALRPEVLQAAQSVPTVRRAPFYLQAATLLALARIGDPTALPNLQAVETRLDPYFKEHLLPVVNARIHAESRVPSPRTSAEWQEKSTHFLERARVSLAEAPKILEQYHDLSQQWSPENILYAPRAVWALRQLAEMATNAYANGVKDAFDVFAPIAMHLEKDYALWVRIQLGQRSSQERIHWLVNQLAERGVETFEDRYLMQALADCGAPAIPVIRANLKERMASPAAKRVGASLLLKVLAVVEEPSATSLLERFTAVSDEYIAQEARICLQRRLSGERPTFVAWW
jgi:hypothetical protein